MNYVLVGSIDYGFISLGSLDQFRERKERIGKRWRGEWRQSLNAWIDWNELVEESSYLRNNL